MTRSGVTELRSRHPLGGLLPALYAGDDFAQRFTAGLDQVLAPILSTVDNLAAYLDPALAPPDFLGWLAGWVAVGIDPEWPLPLRRSAVAGAVESHRWQGTRLGLIRRLRQHLGVDADVVDGPGAIWSPTPGTPLPPRPSEAVVVRVWPDHVDPAAVEAVVAASCPAHLTWTVQILPGPPAGDA